MREFSDQNGPPIRILYEDNHLLAAVKPYNLPVQADASGDLDMLTMLKTYIGRVYEKPGKVFLGLVHRLDRPAGGCMIFARTSKAAARLSAAFAEHTVDKRYLAVVRGSLTDAMDRTDWLAVDTVKGTVRAADAATPGAKQARLISRPLATRNDWTLVSVELLTGRKHQIRVQHALAGHPLWGDARYGQGRPGEQLALWAYQLTVPHPTRHVPITLMAPPPRGGIWREFDDVIGGMSWINEASTPL